MSSKSTSGTKRPQHNGKDQRSSTWTILGESSIVLAMVSTILFMIGWTYESNWYGYFGINTIQIDLPLPQILIRSLPIIVVSLLITFFVYIVVSLYGKFQGLLLRPQISEQTKLKLISIFTPIVMFLYSILRFPFSQTNNNLLKIRQLPLEGIAASLVMLIVVTYILAGSIPDLLVSIRNLQPMENVFISSLEKVPSSIWMTLFGSVNLVIILFMSVSMAFSDAESGRKGLSETRFIQKVYLVSPKSLDFSNEFELSTCYEKNCFYGPLGLVAENSNSFFLIQLSTQQNVFSRDPGIYEIPRSDVEGSFFVVPASQSILVPTPTPTPSPILTSTMTPSPLPTETPSVPTILIPATPTP